MLVNEQYIVRNNTGVWLKYIVLIGYGVLFLLLTATLFAQINLGLADNGDFTRAMAVFTSRPLHIEPNWPNRQTQEELWNRRFFNFYIPDWKLDFPEPFSLSRPFKSSAYLLWVLGVVLNQIAYSGSILNLGVMSIPSRLVLLLVVGLVFGYILQTTKPLEALILLFSCGLPMVFLLLSPYSFYLNSFYYESAALVFSIWFLFSIVLIRHLKINVSIKILIAFVLSFLVGTTKASQFWWPVVCGFSLLFILKRMGIQKKIVIIMCAILLTIIAHLVTLPDNYTSMINAYNRIFFGFLTLSSDPKAHLDRMELSDLVSCIGVMPYTLKGNQCFAITSSKLSLYITLDILAREPVILLRGLVSATESMQIISLDYLGILAESDPRTPFTGSHYYPWQSQVWLALKSLLPKGIMLLVTLFIGVLICAFALAQFRDIRADFGIVGTTAGVATVIDIIVEFLGDGFYEIIKHLFVANLMFDIMVICATSIALLSLITWISVKIMPY